MEDKELAISETIRLIKTNHKVDDNVEQVLSELYDLGYKNGTLCIKCGYNYRKHPDIKKFDIERDVIHRAKEVNPMRTGNERNLKYNGVEIETDHVLVCDYTFNGALNEMKNTDVNYAGFNANIGDSDSYQKSLNYCEEDPEELAYTIKQYNELEVSILFNKLYQVGMSIACNEVYEMPSPVKSFFSYQKMTKEMDAEGMDVENMKRRLVTYESEIKGNYPDYESWREFYLD